MFYYVVEFSDPDYIANYIRHSNSDLTDTFYTLDHMRPFTSYTIRVSVHNRVSDQDEQNADDRTVETYARTKEGCKICIILCQRLKLLCILYIYNCTTHFSGNKLSHDLYHDLSAARSHNSVEEIQYVRL